MIIKDDYFNFIDNNRGYIAKVDFKKYHLSDVSLHKSEGDILYLSVKVEPNKPIEILRTLFSATHARTPSSVSFIYSVEIPKKEFDIFLRNKKINKIISSFDPNAF